MAKTLLLGVDSALSFSAASTTSFVDCHGGPRQRTTNENRAQMPVRVAAKVRKLRVFVESNARTTATSVTLFINGLVGLQTVSIGAGVTGWVQDILHEDVLANGDLIDYHVVTGTGAGALVLTTFIMEFEALTGDRISTPCYCSDDAASKTDAGTQRAPIEGFARTTIFNWTSVVGGDGRQSRAEVDSLVTISNLWVNVTQFSMNINPTITLFINGVATGVTITITGTGIFEDTVNTASAVPGDYLEWVLNPTGRTSGTLGIVKVACQAKWTGQSFDVIGFIPTSQDPTTFGWNTGTRFANPGGRVTASATEALRSLMLPFVVTASKLRVIAINNDGVGNNFPVTLRRNAADSGNVLSIPPGVGSNTFTKDTTHFDTFNADDLMSVKTVTINGTSGLYQIGITLQEGSSNAVPGLSARRNPRSRQQDEFFGRRRRSFSPPANNVTPRFAYLLLASQ